MIYIIKDILINVNYVKINKKDLKIKIIIFYIFFIENKLFILKPQKKSLNLREQI
jgi:hypothetical protein